MKRFHSFVFSLLMLCAIVANSILEIELAAKAVDTEWNEAEKTKNEKDETESDDNEPKASEDKETQNKDKDTFLGNHNISSNQFDVTAELKAGLTHHYAANLCQISYTLETPPPEVVCI
jgi:Ni/Co efflux regulator RcnB